MSTIDEEVQELTPAWGTPEYEAARRGTDPAGTDFTKQRKFWPAVGPFTLERAHDPYNPSNRSAGLKRRSSDR